MPAVLERAIDTSSGELFARVGKIELCYETFGADDAPPMLLVMGLASQMVLWDDDFCKTLAGHGFFVIRFDNRDVGRSTILREARIPSQTQLLLRDRRAAAYSLQDMAGDAAGLLEQLRIGAAHVVGVSMGGMIAQLLAIHHPQRVRSLVSIMSSTGSRRVGQPHPRMYARLLRRPKLDREGYIADFADTYRAIGSKDYPPDPDRLRMRATRCFERGIHPDGNARQLAAVVAAPDRTPLLRELRVPPTVIPGSADPLVRPSGGRATAEAIPGARLLILPDMGDDLPPALWPPIIDAIAHNASAADR
jgi:pimeloyl-ACP methyl ester carboxylesterase